MPKNDETTTDVNVDTDNIDDNRPEMVTITLDNREVTVPKDAVEVLKQKEHDIQSGYDKKLAEERARIREEAEKNAQALEEDLQWYRTHADRPELWDYYEAKVMGGDGEAHIPENIVPDHLAKDTPKNANTVSNTAFGANSKVASLEKELKTIRENIARMQEKENEKSMQDVIIAKESLKSKYPQAFDTPAKQAMVNRLLEQRYYKLGRHPTKVEVEEEIQMFAKTISNASAKDTGKTSLPHATGSPPSLKPEKAIPLREDTLDERAAQDAEWIREFMNK